MADHTWLCGDGIQVNISIGTDHAVDREGVHNSAFGPEAAEDPGTGVRVSTDGKVTIGHLRCPAVALARAQARVSLLHRLLDGVELPDARWESVYRARGTATGRRHGNLILRPTDLFWRTGSGEQWADFASLLEERFNLSRSVAWRLAWALVRAAYSGRWENVETLIQMAPLADGGATASSDRKTVPSVPASPDFATILDAAIATLKRLVLS